MAYTYRTLADSDVPLLKNLLTVFGEAFGEPDTYQNAVPSERYLRNLLGKQHFIVLVALAGDAVVGGLVAYELQKFEQERKEIYIYDLAVSAAHRRKGVATSLMRELQRIASERGAYVIFVQADQGDTPAIRLYESLGKREDVHHFDIPV
ncbi:MAG: AAC(3)-I family aminoglycoside N-acetyltransferase [candidate division KSB1 bacterium]|nr:AAC(3)-I family aminoglycoside N-acetyltransferase [candidate division KSB1 bacterium]MDZ7274178.1 AAC(3)-I family aminoglycoside N-acetyltransferase [candidate division KSB1 bacterium]MDZ7287778.1 AAC(3)-I family aminoglycoside N-acetyltransferase [candidate division KSB1 bacterium]MDZ7296776.1 AAC(3)-I family aminoglycoside N-acetyltransferase [candidate division KSB1 bacterium]MDZ7347642.1 AAC(3)-I family aminoglycoside N-acetyltransferase [candidate division KSB1 bacterium]